jgi:hypothetical protein
MIACETLGPMPKKVSSERCGRLDIEVLCMRATGVLYFYKRHFLEVQTEDEHLMASAQSRGDSNCFLTILNCARLNAFWRHGGPVTAAARQAMAIRDRNAASEKPFAGTTFQKGPPRPQGSPQLSSYKLSPTPIILEITDT